MEIRAARSFKSERPLWAVQLLQASVLPINCQIPCEVDSGRGSGRVRSLNQPPSGGEMPSSAETTRAPATIRTDLGAIFVSLELSRSTWLITSLSPGAGEKMSKRSVLSGDIGGLLAQFQTLRERTWTRTRRAVPLVVIQEAGLDGFWIHRVL